MGNNNLPLCFQKHEDESDSWLHRQVSHASRRHVRRVGCVCKRCFSNECSLMGRRESLHRMNPRSSPETVSGCSSPEPFHRGAEGSFSTYQCPLPRWAVTDKLPHYLWRFNSTLNVISDFLLSSLSAQQQRRHTTVPDVRRLGRDADFSLQRGHQTCVSMWSAAWKRSRCWILSIMSVKMSKLNLHLKESNMPICHYRLL